MNLKIETVSTGLDEINKKTTETHPIVRDEEGKLKKHVDYAFRKFVYLLGINNEGKTVWLEAPTWDCEWYWVFGYIEEYTTNTPSKARDINSHSHWDASIVGSHEYYDHEKKCFRKGEYVHHLNDNKSFKETVLSDKESWELADLMSTFYALKNAGEVFRAGNSHITSTEIQDSLKDEDMYIRINTVEIPKIFKRIDEILSK